MEEGIRDRDVHGRRAFSMLNKILCDISKVNKTRIYDSIVKTIITYRCVVWQLKSATETSLLVTEMDCWNKTAEKSGNHRVKNGGIREIMDVRYTIKDYIRTKQLI